MTLGPITIFDKSFLQSLNPDEACWFANFYRANITPLFFVETLADLEKEVAKGRTPEQVVGSIAYKTPILGAAPNVLHSHLCVADLLGGQIQTVGFPVVSHGEKVVTGDRKGVMFDQPPEFDALQRWQEGDFLQVERRFARVWRRSLSALNLERSCSLIRSLGADPSRIRDLSEAKAWADQLVRKDGYRFAALKAASSVLGIPDKFHTRILERWKKEGGPPLADFSPYAAYVLTVDLFFYLALAASLISRERPSNKIDIAYLYYLPFCMVFVSNDNLHARVAPLFTNKNNVFVHGSELKADLARLDAYYSVLPQHVRERGVMAFAPYPPLDGEYLTSRLWDTYLPKWRENAQSRKPRSREEDEKVMGLLKPMIEAAKQVGDRGPDSLDDADFLVIQRSVPTRMGKWRLVPPEVEEAATE